MRYQSIILEEYSNFVQTKFFHDGRPYYRQLYLQVRKDCLNSLVWLANHPRLKVNSESLKTYDELEKEHKEKSVKELRELIRGYVLILSL